MKINKIMKYKKVFQNSKEYKINEERYFVL